MKIIMLSGESDCGKSTTLNLVYDYINPQKENIIKSKSNLGNPKNNDFECVIRYKNKTIAFFTMGDFKKKLCEAFVKYANSQYDIFICACRPNFLSQLIKDYPHIINIKKTMPLNCESNEIDKNRIIEEIEI